jgi:aminotransferase
MEAHVALIPGDSFGENGKGYLRVSYAASTDELNEALDRMHQLLSTV